MKKYIPPFESKKNHARLSILNYILKFSTMVYYGDDSWRRSKDCSFRSHLMQAPPEIGALCTLMSAPNTKWYLSWLVDIDRSGSLPIYVMESIEDGQLCNWTNISFLSLPLELTNKFPEWRWVDNQFAFQDSLHKAFRKADCFASRPEKPKFADDGSVVVSTYSRWRESELSVSKTFSNYKKVRLKDLVSFAKHADKIHSKNNKK